MLLLTEPLSFISLSAVSNKTNSFFTIFSLRHHLHICNQMLPIFKVHLAKCIYNPSFFSIFWDNNIVHRNIVYSSIKTLPPPGFRQLLHLLPVERLLDDHLLWGIRKAHLHRTDRLKMVIKIPRQNSPTGLLPIIEFYSTRALCSP